MAILVFDTELCLLEIGSSMAEQFRLQQKRKMVQKR